MGSSEQIAIIELAKKVIDATGSSSTTVFVPFEDAYGHGIEDMLHRIPSTDKIRAAIGWQPTLELDQILRDVIDHATSSVVA